MTSPKPVDAVAALKVGSEDISGNKVLNVLALGNEYCIYEIECDDINNALKIFIEGYNPESENELIKRFNTVKQNYIKAKGLLYRSSNYGMMKNRVAHALATSLTSTEMDGNIIFEALIKEITDEQNRIVINRLCYLLPASLSILIWFIFCYLFMEERNLISPNWQIFSGFLASSLGTSASILTGIRKLHFEEYQMSKYYFFIGLERLLLGYTVGAIAYIALKSGVLSPAILKSTYWSNLMILVVAGFSEHLIPSIIKKVNA